MRRFSFALPFLAVPLAAAACGGGKSASSTNPPLPDDPFAAVKGAARKTAASGSEHMKLSGRVRARGQTFTFTGGGDFDTKAHVSSMNVDVSLGGLNTAVQEVSHGADVFVKSDLLTAMLPAGKKWVKLDLEKTAKSAGAEISALISQDPAKALTQLQSLRGVKKVGTAR